MDGKNERVNNLLIDELMVLINELTADNGVWVTIVWPVVQVRLV